MRKQCARYWNEDVEYLGKAMFISACGLMDVLILVKLYVMTAPPSSLIAIQASLSFPLVTSFILWEDALIIGGLGAMGAGLLMYLFGIAVSSGVYIAILGMPVSPMSDRCRHA